MKDQSVDFKNKVIIITGGSSGIGQAAAFQFADQGAKVLITGRRPGPLEETASQHQNIKSLQADAGNPEDTPKTIKRAVELWDRIDVLVNNAGAGFPMSLEESTADDVNDIFTTNVTGPTLLAKEALPHLKISEGSIINISSTFGHKASAGIGHYAASKAALEHLTRCWALELAPENIRVNTIAPGPTETAALEQMMGLSKKEAEAVKEQERNTIPLGRRGNPEEVAHWILSLANPASSWITGQTITVDGGFDIA
ncbi:SDR family NAD(P)-dependent oxidoreductase [Fodinibius salsisoli]|uniref:SDR family oxidoreductase n=1 Tax=Fodinibius salsisoli TaxID=2820877 RepID=A0ABT3PK57_9BACT|nr:SDR family oxidoreductase [Fodinibius salsisoli]MCW9705564.1 SDR family oxidoreductase [Fodinibius salsisoli]